MENFWEGFEKQACRTKEAAAAAVANTIGSVLSKGLQGVKGAFTGSAGKGFVERAKAVGGAARQAAGNVGSHIYGKLPQGVQTAGTAAKKWVGANPVKTMTGIGAAGFAAGRMTAPSGNQAQPQPPEQRAMYY